jgi:cell wall-associated NlpC family hydrolase
VCASLAAVTLLAGPATAAPVPAPTPAPNPTSLTQAQRQKTAADRAVADLTTRIKQETRQLAALSAAADRARQRYAAQVLAQRDAAAQVRAAQQVQQQAQRDYDQAHAQFVQLLVYTYEQDNSPVANSAYALLTASDPSQVLDALEMAQLADDHQAAVVHALRSALAQKAAAGQRRRDALQQQRTVTAALGDDQRAAEQALARARTGLTNLRRDIGAAKKTQAAAVAALSAYLGGWSMADPAQAAALNARYRKLAAPAAAAPLPRNPGHWTPALGRYAANRALAWIGTPYAWAGGNAAGPTRGVCAGNGAQHDCQVVGFDCSGLALYGWAPFRALPHLASTQYSVAGRVHPAINELQPGDLVFWSDGGTVAGIHHVAVYIGEGLVVQAPQSGDIVRVTPLRQVDSGYFGATRPLT